MSIAPDLVLAESLTSRLCHDMAGLVATLSGTLDMVLEEHDADSEAADLASEAARGLAARLRLYRAAWGGGDMEQTPLSALAAGLPNRARLTLDIAALDEARAAGALTEDAARLVLCLLLAASAGLPAGGTVRGTPAGAGIALDISGRNAAWPASLTAGAPPGHAPAAPMARLVAGAMGWRLDMGGTVLTAGPRNAGGTEPVPPDPPSSIAARPNN